MTERSHIEAIEKEWEQIEDGNAWNQVYQKVRSDGTYDFALSDARSATNRRLNRYGDVLPYDHSRIILQHPSTDYINASLVKVENIERQYILTQGPLSQTTQHFWLMVWQQRCKAIVMLNKIIEKNMIKCHQYWPLGEANGGEDSLAFPDVGLKVELVSEVKHHHYIYRTLRLSELSTSECRDVLHFHYTTWPDFGVPASPEAFNKFLVAVISSGCLEPSVGPPVVHCSAGIGRSGTFCLVDSLLVMLERGLCSSNVGTVLEVLLDMRRYRMGLIQTPDQLRFCYQAIVHAAKQRLAHTGLLHGVAPVPQPTTAAAPPTDSSLHYPNNNNTNDDNSINSCSNDSSSKSSPESVAASPLPSFYSANNNNNTNSLTTCSPAPAHPQQQQLSPTVVAELPQGNGISCASSSSSSSEDLSSVGAREDAPPPRPPPRTDSLTRSVVDSQLEDEEDTTDEDTDLELDCNMSHETLASRSLPAVPPSPDTPTRAAAPHSDTPATNNHNSVHTKYHGTPTTNNGTAAANHNTRPSPTTNHDTPPPRPPPATNHDTPPPRPPPASECNHKPSPEQLASKMASEVRRRRQHDRQSSLVSRISSIKDKQKAADEWQRRKRGNDGAGRGGPTKRAKLESAASDSAE